MKKFSTIMLLSLASTVLCANDIQTTTQAGEFSEDALLLGYIQFGLNCMLDSTIKGAGKAPYHVFNKEQGKLIPHGESDWHGQRILHRLATTSAITAVSACIGGLIAGSKGVSTGVTLAAFAGFFNGALEVMFSLGEGLTNRPQYNQTGHQGNFYLIPGLASILCSKILFDIADQA